MTRILVTLAGLMFLGCALLIMEDAYNGHGLRVIYNVKQVLIIAGISVFMAPLGILILVNTYGVHYLVFAFLSIVAMAYGVIVCRSLHGQVIAVLGVLSWMFLGAAGLGHAG